jgi:hypothetical protein
MSECYAPGGECLIVNCQSCRITELEAKLDDCVSISYASMMVLDETSELAEENRELEAEALKLQKRFDAMEKAYCKADALSGDKGKEIAKLRKAHQITLDWLMRDTIFTDYGQLDYQRSIIKTALEPVSNTVTGKLHR